jgi:predicted molibdopterin-dependent oxidoreductase YjgC
VSRRAPAEITPWRRDPTRSIVPTVRLTVGGAVIDAAEGQSLAVALALAGYLQLRRSPTARTPRGMFCLMGSCQECVIRVDGATVLACLEPVRAGMRVELDRLTERAAP